MTLKLYYAHDPMCSWCWAFRSSLLALLENLPEEIEVVRLLGGLAPDNETPMPEQTRLFVQGHWRKIEQHVPNTKFNYDFWVKCEPRRSTYSACRAVIAARSQGASFDSDMTLAIQEAYYLNARNPSLESTLVELAEELGLDKKKFKLDLSSVETNEVLQEEIKQARHLGLNSFPSLFLTDGDKCQRIKPDYLSIDVMLDEIYRLKN